MTSLRFLFTQLTASWENMHPDSQSLEVNRFLREGEGGLLFGGITH